MKGFNIETFGKSIVRRNSYVDLSAGEHKCVGCQYNNSGWCNHKGMWSRKVSKRECKR